MKQSADASALIVSDAEEQARLIRLQRSGLFDGAWFAARNPDLAAESHSALIHWHRQGWQENRLPNAYFDTGYYRERNPDCTGDPLLHYIDGGEAAGRRPSLYFDPAWYRRQYGLDGAEHCLAHFLRHRFTGRFSPIPEFDSAFYLQVNADVAAAGMDPMEHYLIAGAREGRHPTRGFDPRKWSGPRHDQNPLQTLLRRKEQAGLAGDAPNIAAEVRRATRPNPAAEDVRPLPPGLERKAKLLAYYLPQFHILAENDAWWGKGFTEWTNLGRALPRFVGHCQPRIPRDLGHYSLDTPETLRRQIAMALGAGLHGFVFYFYWFNRRRLLEAPLEVLLADPSLAMPFCLMWANENWTRRWDGSDERVLVSQDYRVRDEAALMAEWARHFADSRYIRLGGRPLLMIYRASLIPDVSASVQRWRRLLQANHGENPLFVMAQSFGERDPRQYGMDAAVEFPPHKLTGQVSLINDTLQVLDPAFDAEVYDYAAIARISAGEPAPAYPLIKTAAPGWDNDPRREGAGTVLHGATPALYQAWLEDMIRYARRHRVEGEAIVCINAWNEWAEGATLEPDLHWGGAFLNATGRAVSGLPAPSSRTRLLLVGHDALRHGSQRLLLGIGRALRTVHGVDVSILLLAGGPLEAEYNKIGPTTVVDAHAGLDGAVRLARDAGCTAALVNSAASAGAAPSLLRQGLPFTLLVHEMPQLLQQKNLLGTLREAVTAAQAVVFPAALVRDRCLEALAVEPARVVILPQGIELAAAAAGARDAVRAELRAPPGTMLALGMGYADLRKGFDLFLQVWRAARESGRAVSFAWAGEIEPAARIHLGPEIAAAEATGTFRFLGQRDDPAALLTAADVFLLTSREDPLPSVALEAVAAGTQVVAFEETGGVPALLAKLDAGLSVPIGEVAAMAKAAIRLAGTASPVQRQALAARGGEAFRFDAYTAGLLALAKPELLPVSVVVLSCDFGHFMQERLASVFAQSHPVREVIVLDDASSDDSVAVARRTASAWDRRIDIREQPRRSGSVFGQWRTAAEAASAEWLWIAEADDAAEPGLLAALVDAIGRARDPVFAFCDSRAIDAAGATIWPDYQAYYGPAMLDTDAVFEGGSFIRTHLAERNLILNVSAVLWRRDALLAALRRCEGELKGLRLAGDWRVYADILSREGAQVAYVARPLNRHRRHAGSVTARAGTAAQVTDIGRVHAAIARLLDADRGLRQRQLRYKQSVARRSS